MDATIKVAESPEKAASDCAAFVLDVLKAADKPTTIAISGGTTPKLLFQDLARSEFDWSNVHVFWVDERCVPPTDSASNFKLANDAWFVPAKFPAANIHRVFGELEPSVGGKKYADELIEFFKLSPGEIPVFDILHRGMGADGHTASLFPGNELVHDRTGIATNVWVEKTKMHRVTLLPAVLMAARQTVLQVSGHDKADALKSVLQGPEDWMQFPCQIASRDAKATWFLDQAAAAKL